MVQWINLNQNNRSVLAHQYSVLHEKTGPILLPLVGLMADRQAGRKGSRLADETWVGLDILEFFTD